MYYQYNIYQSVLWFALLTLLAMHCGCGCQKTEFHEAELTQPKEVVTVDQKVVDSTADGGQSDFFESTMKEILETMLARRYEKAVELLEKAISYYDKNKSSNTEELVTFLSSITYCHVMLGHAEKGIPYIERACQLMPETSYFWGVCASVFLRLERYDEAIERLIKAIELQQKSNPYFFSSEEQLGYFALFTAYNSKGELKNAYDVYKTIKSRLEGYQFHVEPAINEFVQYLVGINDENWESMPRYRVSKKLPPHPKEIDDSSVPTDMRDIYFGFKIEFELIDDTPK